MRITKLHLENFKGFDTLDLDEQFFKENKFLLVGKNGSGKTTLLEAIRLSVSTRHQSNTQIQPGNVYYNYLKDPSRQAVVEIHLSLDDDEKTICQDYYDSLLDDGAMAFTPGERDQYSAVVESDIVTRIAIQATVPAVPGQAYTASLLTHGAYLTASSDERGDGKHHIINKLFIQRRDAHRDLVYINPFRGLQLTDAGLFQSHSIAQYGSGMMMQQGQIVNDPAGNHAYAQPEYAKTFAQFNFGVELYDQVLGEFYKLADESEPLKKKMRAHVKQKMKHVNEMIAPKYIDDILIDPQANTIAYQINSNGKTHALSGISAGEEQLLLFGLTLPKHLSASKDVIKPIVLVDEPELHLHPEYCRRLGKFFNSHLDLNNGQQLFVTTHSVELVQELAESAYQIKSGRVTPINDVNGRAELFHGMGANFSVADLVSKVVFVEGDQLTKKHLIDQEVYQVLLGDPHAKSVKFVSVGSKSAVWRMNLSVKEWREFIKTEIDTIKDGNVFSIVDGDILNWVLKQKTTNKNVLELPCYSFENLVLQPDIVKRAYNDKTGDEIDKMFNELKPALVVHTAGKLEGEYNTRIRNDFKIDAKKDRAVNTQVLMDLMDEHDKHIKELIASYKRRVARNKNWYLRVDGKQLAKELSTKLGISGGKAFYKQLLEKTTLEDAPKSVQDWFNKNLV